MAAHPRPVVLQIPADPDLLRVARVTLSAVATELPLGLQEIEDLRVAVDELAAAVIEGCDPADTLTIEMAVDGDLLTVRGWIDAREPLPALHPVAADLLAMVIGEHQLEQHGDRRTFAFAKRASVPAA